MIDLKKLKFKNFLSYGNTLTEYEFSKGITRISGTNGTGKSSIPDVIYFALFGKPYRKIKIAQLINSINKKNLVVELEFVINSDEYKVVRALKPDKFEIYKNGQIVPLSSHKKSYQEVLENDILKFSESLFNQTVYKSMTKNLSFFSMTKDEKRKLIENILDIEHFSGMSEIVRENIKNLTNSIKEHQTKIDYTERLIQNEIANIEKLRNMKKELSENAKERIGKIQKEIDALKKDNTKHNTELAEIQKVKSEYDILKAESNSIQQEINENNSEMTRLKSELSVQKDKLILFQNTCKDCPKIDQIFDKEKMKQDYESIKKLKAELPEKEKLLSENMVVLRKKESVITNERTLKALIEKNNSSIANLNNSITEEKEQDLKVDETKLLDFKNQKVELDNNYNAINVEMKHYQALKLLISDEGIKSYIIKKYLPHINSALAKYLQKFQADIIFCFDSEFNEVIKSRFKEGFDYFSFSEGQKRRMDLAIMFAFMDFCKFRSNNNSTNVLIFDEIMSGLDSIGENALYEIFDELVKKEGKEIITITHSTGVDPDKIDTIYKTTISAGFSKLTRIE